MSQEVDKKDLKLYLDLSKSDDREQNSFEQYLQSELDRLMKKTGGELNWDEVKERLGAQFIARDNYLKTVRWFLRGSGVVLCLGTLVYLVRR